MPLPSASSEVQPELSYRSLLRAVQTLPRQASTLCADNLSFITRLGEPATIVAYLRAILADPSAITAIAARSYHHVNHFDKVVLVDSPDPDGYRLTLHCWDPPYPESALHEELIHDHRFSFWSHILTGELVSEYFARADAGMPFQEYRYLRERPAGSTQKSFTEFYEYVGDVWLTRMPSTRERAGDSYYLHHERIHRVLLPRETITCTLVLRGPVEREYSHVFNTVYPGRDLKRQNVTFAPEELSVKLARVATTLERTRLGR